MVDRNPAVENNQMMNRECSMHLEQIDKLKRWHLSQLSSAQSTGSVTADAYRVVVRGSLFGSA